MIVELSVNGLNDYYKRLKKASEMFKKMKPEIHQKNLYHIFKTKQMNIYKQQPVIPVGMY